jgi:hypothetical protein
MPDYLGTTIYCSFYHCDFIANFLLFAEGKTSKFPAKKATIFAQKRYKICNPAGDFVLFGRRQIGNSRFFITIQYCSSKRATLPQIAKAYLSPAGLLLWDYHLTKRL